MYSLLQGRVSCSLPSSSRQADVATRRTIKDLGRAVSRIANVHPEAINLVPQQILSVGSRTNAKRRVFKYFTLDGVIYAVSKSIKMVSEELYAIENAGNICLADSPNVEAGEDGSVGGASATGNTALSTFIAGRKREIAHRHAVSAFHFNSIVVWSLTNS